MLHRGEDYSIIKPVYQIGFIDFTLFEDHPEFFAQYQLKNAKDGYLYTDKFNILVVELSQTDLATAEDKSYGIDKWAKLFKATTWEEIKMLTKENPSMNSAAESIYLSNSDENIRELCRRREDAIAHENFQKKLIQNLTEENAALSDEVARLQKLLDDNNIKF